MRKRLLLSFLSFLALLGVLNTQSITGQSNNYWTKASQTRNQHSSFEGKVDFYQLDMAAFKTELFSKTSKKTISLPNQDTGKEEIFELQETKILPEALSKKYHSLSSYRGVSKDGEKEVSLIYCEEYGLTGVVTYGKIGTVSEIRPTKDGIHQLTYKTKGQQHKNGFECQVEEKANNLLSFGASTARDVDDGFLRKYRLALSVTGQYSQHFLNNTEENDEERITKVLAGMVNTVNRLNGIFERDFGVTMELVPNNDLLIYLDSSNDPYTTGDALNGQLQSTLDNVIGSENYDVGHLFHKEPSVYGNAGCIACVCTFGSKGSAFSVHEDPSGEGMTILAAHEFGHQFGAYHTQSSGNCRSGINSESEPGSGSTIMSYAGICFPNVQELSDDYFNFTSIRDVAIWTINDSSCAELIPTGNAAPTVEAGNNYNIPKSTPFVLEGQADDIDSVNLTYCWEQADVGNPFVSDFPLSTQPVGPLFRSFLPTTSNKRYMPRLEDVVTGNLTPTWEVLPSIARDLNFVLTVRDNSVNGGQTASDAMTVSVIDTPSAFEVTSQQSSENWFVGESKTITWNVAETNQNPISVSQVEILLSTDSGVTFDTSILVTDNDGEATFNVPVVANTENARLMVKAVDNIFYAVNQAEISIENTDFAIFMEDAEVDVCNGGTATLTGRYLTFNDFEDTITLSSEFATGVDADYEFSPATISGSHLEGIEFTATKTVNSNETVIIKANNTIEDRVANVSITTFEEGNLNFDLITPSNNVITDRDVQLSYSQNNNISSYVVQLSVSSDFNEFLVNEEQTSNSYLLNNLNSNTTYYWRVLGMNPCSESFVSDVYSFTTICAEPTNISIATSSFDSVELNWDADESTNWNIEYGETGFVVGTGNVEQSSNNTITINSLSSGTSYDVYIQSICSTDNISANVGPFRVTTPSNFCGGDRFFDSGGEFGQYSNNEFTETVMAPMNEGDRVRVVFDSFNIESGYDFLTIYNGASISSPEIGRYTGSQLLGEQIVADNELGTLTFIFDSDSSVIRDGWSARVFCEPIPNCESPSNISITENTREASISWIAVGDDSNWSLEYGVSGFSLGSGETTTANTTEVILEDLTPLTSYDVYIKTVCDDGGFSQVVGPFDFTTLDACPQPNIVDVSVTKNSAIIEVEASGDNFVIEYGTFGFVRGEGTTISSETTSILLGDLQSNTSYQAFIRQDCGELDGLSFEIDTEFTTNKDFCSGDRFFDSGGEFSNYSNRENSTTLISPDTIEDRVSVEFISFDLESGFDFLTIYNGDSVTAPVIGTFSSNSLQGQTYIANNESGSLFFRFTSDGSVTRSGWEAEVTCSPRPNCSTPMAVDLVGIDAFSATYVWQDTTTDRNWEIVYGETQDFVNGISSILNVSTNEVNFTDLSPETSYSFEIYAVCDEGGISDQVGPFQFTTDVACNVPLGFTYTETNPTSIDLSWMASSDISEWELQYGFNEFELGNGTIVSQITDANYLLEGLESNTTYDFYLRANCGVINGFSQWTNVLTITTDCAVFEAPFSESFTTLNTMPDCWEQSENLGWSFNNFPRGAADNLRDRNVNEETFYAWVDASNTAFNGDYILNSPLVDLSELENPSLQFSVFSDNNINDVLNTLTVTIQDNLNEAQDVFVLTNRTFNNWRDVVIDLSSLGLDLSSIKAQFKVTLADDFDKNLNDIVIDEVKFEEMPTCINPNSLQASNPTGRSVDLVWISEGNEMDWEIQYGIIGSGINEFQSSFTTQNPYTLEGLEPETDYIVSVRAVCGMGDTSEFTSNINFTTTESCPTPTSFEVSEITLSSALFTWDNVEDGNWVLEYAEAPLTIGEGTIVNVNTNQFELTDLESGTFYEAVLKRDCGELDGQSDYTEVLNFGTNADYCGGDKFIYTGIENYDEDGDGIGSEIFIPENVGERISITFNSFNLFRNIDAMAIYDGPDDSFPLLNVYSGNDLEGNTIRATNEFGALTILFFESGTLDEAGWEADVICEPIPNCSAPLDVIITDIGGSTATVNWTDNENEQSWIIEYGQDGFELGTGTILEVSGSPVTSITNLSQLTSYDVYLTTSCLAGGVSDVAGPISFSTIESCSNNLPEILITGVSQNSFSFDILGDESSWQILYSEAPLNTAPIQEDFSSNSITLENLEPNTTYQAFYRRDCGDDGVSVPSQVFTFTTLGDFCNGDVFTDLGGIDNNYNVNENYTVTIPAEEGERVRVFFEAFSVENTFDFLTVYDGLDTNATLIGSYTGSQLLGQEIVGGSETGALTFNFTSDEIIPNSGWIANVICEPMPNCVAPEAIEIGNITESSAMINWSVVDNEDDFIIEYGEEGFTLGNGNIINHTTPAGAINNIEIGGLSSSTVYDVYIRTSCSIGGVSDFIKTSFTTSCSDSLVEGQLLLNGSFECSNATPWSISGPQGTGCSQGFVIAQNSNNICLNSEVFLPTDGEYGIFLSFDGEANTNHALSQTFNIPENIETVESIDLSFDFSISYNTTIGATPTQPRQLIVSITGDNGVTFEVTTIEFATDVGIDRLDVNFSEDVLAALQDIAIDTATLTFEAFIPEGFTGPSIAMIDNISLKVEETLSVSRVNEDLSKSIDIYPIPSNGNFTISTDQVGVDTVRIIDITGTVIYSDTTIAKNDIEVNLKGRLAAGVYFVEVNTGRGKAVKKIIIE